VAFTRVAVSRTYQSADGTPAEGTVTLTPVTPMINGPTVIAAPIPATLSSIGVATWTNLAATTDPGTLPVNAAYWVDERLTGQKARRYAVRVPHDAGSSLDLSSLDELTEPGLVPVGGGAELDPDLVALGNLGDGNPHRAAGSWATRSDAALAAALGVGGGSGVTTINGEAPDGTGNVVVSAADVGAQPADADLTGLAALGDGYPQRAAGVWSVRSAAQLAADLGVGSSGGAVSSVNGQTGAVVLTPDSFTDGSTNHVFTAADDTKLGGIAAGATANSTDAQLRDRSTHTGTQTIHTLTATGTPSASTYLRGDGTWSPGSSVVGPIVYADAPPSGLTAVVFNDSTDAKPALQAQLNYLSTTYGRGTVVVSSPGAGYKILSSVTIPAKVQLRSDETTLCDATAITSGPAFIVNDTNFAPIVGLRIDGGMFSPTSANLTSNYTGISITGNGLKFEKCHFQYFGRALDVANSNTFGITFEDFTIDHCATGLYADLEASGASNSGEKIVYTGGSIANSVRGFRATANGMHIRFTNTSIDFCTELGSINNARVFYEGHLESGGDGVNNYLFDVTGNSMVDITNTEIVMGGRTGGLYYIFKQSAGPSNYGFGSARFSNVHCFFVDSDGNGQNVRSEHMVSWPSGTTTLTITTPYALRWCTVSAEFIGTDGGVPPNADQIYVSGMNTSTGKITLTSPTFAGQRWVLVRFG
jgi:hypothetical protein